MSTVTSPSQATFESLGLSLGFVVFAVDAVELGHDSDAAVRVRVDEYENEVLFSAEVDFG